MKVLGIESSCDETAAAVVENGSVLLSNVVNSQIDIHSVYGGVVPEVAARSHLEVILPVVEKALSDAGCTWDDIDAIAVTYAPGLVGSLLIGSLSARTLALLKNKPLYPIHHVEGHVYANFINNTDKSFASVAADSAFPAERAKTNDQLAASASSATVSETFTAPSFPILALIVSGGHSQLVLFRDHGDYELLGQTQDDAVGEAFDKVAKIIGLPYPGGPSISANAINGNPNAFDFPKARFTCKHSGKHKDAVVRAYGKAAPSSATSGTEPYRERATEVITPQDAAERCHHYDFSFSGLKTAVLRTVQAEVGVKYDFPSHQLPERVSGRLRVDVAASFQRIAVETLVDKTLAAYQDFQPASVVIAGGVAANQELRRQLSERLPIAIEYASISLCTDNAAMIASLGYFYAQKNAPTDPRDLEVVPSLSMAKTAWAK